MIINLSGWRTFVTRLRPAILLGAGGVVGFWLGAARADGAQLLVVAAVPVALLAILALVWQARFRTRERWQAVLNNYAEREIAKARRRKTLHPAP